MPKPISVAIREDVGFGRLPPIGYQQCQGPLWAESNNFLPKAEGQLRAYSVEKLGNLVFRFFCQSHFIFDAAIKTIMRADTANYKRT
jgi:hypothetical protein